ncbi:myopalladin-like [Thalassophryne amazonica]|uniref:myopalladin-like n=1 Tax=Thalassophryne amazonica TaxID=390379 RepID=UPI0014721C17|nr:myopalladin-like [Thalassophryne amazonica]
MAAPIFTKNLQDVIVSEGQLVVLECRVKGTPSPKVEWYLEGKLIEDSAEFRILQKKEICTLVIAEVFPEDSGLFTCTARNDYGAGSTSAELRVKGKGNGSNHMRPSATLVVEPSQVQEPPSSDLTGLAGRPQPEVTTTSSIKAHSRTIRLDPLISSTVRLDPLNTSTLHLDPHSSSMLRQDPLHTTQPSLDPSSLSSSSSKNSHNASTSSLTLSSLYLPGPSRPHTGPQSSGSVLSCPKPFSASSVVETSAKQEVCRPSQGAPEANTVTSPDVKEAPNHLNELPAVVPLPDPPANSCLKTGTLVNHKDTRSSARAGLHVHFKLPEDEDDEQSDASSQSSEGTTQASVLKEPPPVLAKPKLDPAQLQLLHSQVLLEQQQESEPQPQTQTQPCALVQIQHEIQRSQEASLWPPRMHREPRAAPNTMMPPQQTPAPPLTSAAPSPTSAAASTISSTFSPAPAFRSAPPPAQPKTPSVVTSPPPSPQLNTAPAATLHMTAVTQKSTIHASHLNISSAALTRTASFGTPPAPPASTPGTDSTPASQQITSPATLLRSTHASLMNLVTASQTFSYARPKEFIAAQTFSPLRSPSPTESHVPLLQELAAELNSSAASSPTLPPFSPPPRIFPTRVLMSPTSPPSLVSSPTPGSGQFLNSMFAVRAQSPPHASSPTSSSSTPSPIQNPVAFLSAVLPSLTLSQPTNSMGLPKGAPMGLRKKPPKARLSASEDIQHTKETLVQEIDTKLRFRDDSTQFHHQQKLTNEGKTASRPLGPNIPATVINYNEEYKVSSFEQRLMSEIEFRLERAPVDESDDEVQHDDIPTGKCIAPIFDKKLKNFKAVEGVPVTLSCKVLGIPIPKVYWFKDGKQILRKNVHYKKIREGDGLCALHIESTTSDDDGNYTIMASNPQGRASCSGHLIVQTGPPRHHLIPIHSQRVRARVQEVESDQSPQRFFQPHFLQAPGDMLAHEGRLCRVDCKVSGLPNPELMWLLNGRPIYPDLYHKMLVRENGIHSLVIDPVTKSDGGMYTCIASNKAGQSSFSLELKVVEKEMKHPPQFVEKLQNMGIPEGSPVRLECRVVGLPSPAIFWKKDNDTIPRTKERFSMYQDSTGYVCLLIQPTTKDDAGWYTVSAKNEAGIVSCTCRLDLYAQWHQSIPTPMKKVSSGSRYGALTGQGLDIKSTFSTSETSPILFSSSPPEVALESEEL